MESITILTQEFSQTCCPLDRSFSTLLRTMNSSAILKAGASQAEWELAIAHLVSKGYNSDSAEAWLGEQLWALTRVPDSLYSSLTSYILKYGLWGQIQLSCDNWKDNSALILMKFIPSRRWVHLLSPEGLQLRDLEAYPYHISICFVRDLYTDWDRKRPMMQVLETKYNRPTTVVIPIQSFGSGGTANLGEGVLFRELLPLWQSGGYSYKSGLHISL